MEFKVERIKRKRLSVEAWRGYISLWHASGLSQAQYIRSQGLNRSCFSAWVKRIGRVEQGGEGCGESRAFVSIQVQTEVQSQIPRSAAPGELVLRSARGWALSLPGGIDAAWVSRMLGQLS